jgi:hypothetical protein
MNFGLHILQTVKLFVYLLALTFDYCRYKLPLRSQSHYQNHFKSQSLMSKRGMHTAQTSNFFEIIEAVLLTRDVKSVPLKHVNDS